MEISFTPKIRAVHIFGLLAALLGFIEIFAVFYATFGLRQDGKVFYAGFDSLYFSVITITSVGYGDFAPVNVAGRAIAAIEALLGYIFMGLTIAVLSTYLSQERERRLGGKS